MKSQIRPDILRWPPPRWEVFLGNTKLKRRYKQLLRKLRRQSIGNTRVDANRLCFLLMGESRTGKTAMTKFLVRCLACDELDDDSLNPCNGTCWSCKQRPEQYELGGLFYWDAARPQPRHDGPDAHFKPIDCTKIYTPSELKREIESLNDYLGTGDLVVVYLDEVHRLVNRGMDEILLKSVEEMPFVWMLSTAKPGGLEDMLLNRMIKLTTELPDAAEMEDWLCDRCDEWRIRWEPEAIVRVVEKSNRVVGTALHALALASLDDDEGLTLDLVENDWVVRVEDQ